jgi:hypothetical protein
VAITKRVSKRDFLKVAGVAAAATAAGLTIHELSKSDVDRASERLLELPEGEQRRHLMAIEREIEESTLFGRRTAKFLSGAPEIKVLPYDKSKSKGPFLGLFGSSTYHGGDFDVLKDTSEVRLVKNKDWLGLLRQGKPYLMIAKQHEAAHWLADENNTEDSFIDLCVSYGFYGRGGSYDFSFDVLNTNIKGDKAEIQVEAKNPITEFVLKYGLKYEPEKIRKILNEEGVLDTRIAEQLLTAAKNRFDRFNQSMVNGGLVLTEMHSRLYLDYFDCENLTPRGFREASFEALRLSLDELGIPLDNQRLSAAFDGITKLYALYTSDSDHAKDPVELHRLVTVAVGRSLLSYDKKSGSYIDLTGQVDELKHKLGKSDAEVAVLAEDWVKGHIKERAQYQRTVKELTERYLLKNFGK